MEPALSIVIPTYNRADLLDYTLERLRDLERFGKAIEIVISDNISTDHTAQIIEKHRTAMPYLRYCLRPKQMPLHKGIINGLRNSRGQLVVLLMDDDSFIPETLMGYVERMERESDLTAIYADWIAYDDEKQQELHRYYHFQKPVCFGPQDPLGLINFVLKQRIYPELAVYRRESLFRCECLVKRGTYAAYLWMYRLSRLGRVAFELAPFYREHRVLKKQFQRTHWANMEMRHQLIGDEFRNQLESIVLWALQDTGISHVPEDQTLAVKQLIDQFLHSRLSLEIGRAMAEKNWLLALELRRRMVLWNGPGSVDDQRRDAIEISLPAAMQAVHDTYEILSEVSGLVLQGFRSRQIHDFFRRHYPDLKLLESTAASPAGTGRPLVVYKSDAGIPDDPHDTAYPGYRLYLNRLLENYRVCPVQIDLTGL